MKINDILKLIQYKKFFKETQGVVAIEFALLAPAYLLMLSAVFILGIWLLANVTLTAAVNEAAVKIMMEHPDSMQSTSYYQKFIFNALNKYIPSNISLGVSSRYINNTITYSAIPQKFAGVENSPVIVMITVRYAFPCPVPLVSKETFRFSLTGYAAIVGLTPK